MPSENLKFGYREFGEWGFPIVEFTNPVASLPYLPVVGRIANSSDTKEARQAWKVKVASEIKAVRGNSAWNSGSDYAITLALSFHCENHGKRFDVDNFIKPILDALAAGLFCDSQMNPKDIQARQWTYPDSNFKTLLIHRLPDADSQDKEGVAICVSSR